MGFVLWVDGEEAWAAGTYEYRALGSAVISKTDLFRIADFRRDRRPPASYDRTFVGQFASLGHVNEYLKQSRRRSRLVQRHEVPGQSDPGSPQYRR